MCKKMLIIVLTFFANRCFSQEPPEADFSLPMAIIESKLLIAKELKVSDFFNFRMKNRRMNKLAGMRCIILAENDSVVYFGYPSLGRLKRAYKVNRQKLQARFPLYKTVHGYDVASTASNACRYEVPKEHGGSSFSHTISLEENGIQVVFVQKFRVPNKIR